MTPFQTVARELSSAFTTDTRASGTTFYRFRTGSADWLGSELMHAVHAAVDGRLPDDSIYEAAALAAACLMGFESTESAADGAHDVADRLVDQGTCDLTQWLAAHAGNVELCNEASEVGLAGTATTLVQQIQAGQYLMYIRVIHALIDVVVAEVVNREMTPS